MSEPSSEASNVLVVPQKVIAGFQEVAIGNSDNSYPIKPDTLGSKLTHYTKKSTLVTAPLVSTALTVASFSTAISVIGDNFLVYVASLLGAAFSIVGGILGLAAGFVSIQEGDRSFAPLPASKKYLESKEKAKQVSIAPFDSWDVVFEKNALNATENNK